MNERSTCGVLKVLPPNGGEDLGGAAYE